MLLQINIVDIQTAFTFITVVALVWLLAEFKGMKEAIKERTGINNETIKLKLQAYERLTVFVERAGLKNLVSRTAVTGESVASTQAIMVEEIKSEFEYNVSQQIYVSPEMWNGVTKLKDQNIYIINQIASGLPSNAPGIELSKRLLEYSMVKDAEMNTIVLDALQFEAKKLM